MLLFILAVNVPLCFFACRVAVWRGYGVGPGIVLTVGSPLIVTIGLMLLPPMIAIFLMPLLLLGWLVPCFLPPTKTANEHYAMDAETRRELAEDNQTVPCPQCRRLNSVRTRICPRCDRRLEVVTTKAA